MTEAELWELILMSQSNAWAISASGFPFLTGYLVVAYLIGTRLTRFQIVIVNSLFIVTQLGGIVAGHAAMTRAAFLLAFTSPEYTPPTAASIQYGPLGGAIIGLMLLAACLLFMWQIRHPKSE